MKRSRNPDIGHVSCPLCHETAPVRREHSEAGALYVACDTCGHVTPRREKGQDWILENMTPLAPEKRTADTRPPPRPSKRPHPLSFRRTREPEPPEHEPETAPGHVPPTSPPPPPAPKKPGFFDTLLS